MRSVGHERRSPELTDPPFRREERCGCQGWRRKRKPENHYFFVRRRGLNATVVSDRKGTLPKFPAKPRIERRIRWRQRSESPSPVIANELMETAKECGCQSSALMLRRGGDGLDICGAQGTVPGRLQPSRHPFDVTDKSAAVIARKDVNRVRQLIEQSRKTFGVGRLAELDDLVPLLPIERLR